TFPIYFIAFCVLIIAYCLAVLWFSSKEGRQHVNANWWLIWLLLASFLVAYLGVYGPLQDPVLFFPWGMIAEVAVGIVAYYWALRSGFATDEIKDILASYQSAEPTERPASHAQQPATEPQPKPHLGNA